MKIKKLLEKLGNFLNADTTAQLNEIKSIRKVLKELKQKERELQEKLEKRPDCDECEELRMKLDVIYAQRRKGLDRVKALKEGINTSTSAPPAGTDSADPADPPEVAEAPAQDPDPAPTSTAEAETQAQPAATADTAIATETR